MWTQEKLLQQVHNQEQQELWSQSLPARYIDYVCIQVFNKVFVAFAFFTS